MDFKREQMLIQEFYARPAREVAVNLLGRRLVRVIAGERVSGIIVETEAYCDADVPDLACHGDRANKGRPTERTAVMFGPAGFAYVYFTYGMHWMFNVVTGSEGEANAVLIRALEPIEGMSIMRSLRDRPDKELTNGPAKLAQAMGIDKRMNGAALFGNEKMIWIEEGVHFGQEEIEKGPRIGMGKTPEPWYSMPWRFWVRDHLWVSR
jgi:DNA-3-methyladenine glycosylase